MALDSVNRWQLVRGIITQKRSGVIVLQAGKNYLHWTIDKGLLVCIHSTFPEASLTNFFEEQRIIEPTRLSSVKRQVDHTKPFGSVLLRQHLLNEEDFAKSIYQHWIACTDYLFEPSIHLFWSVNSGIMNPEFIRCDRPLADILMQANRNSITIPTAIRAIEDLKPPFRILSAKPDLSRFNEEERRIWMYLQSGSTLDQIFQDREITKIPCYKLLFLLWVCGHISDSRTTTTHQVQQVTTGLLQRIPAEWIFPLCAGTIIGVLLAPSSPEPKPSPPPPAYRVETLEEEALPTPAWSTTQNEEDLNAETQGRRDERE
ncbi:hypothetical protein L0156_13700 [bacterium]|nr:hypothetical protein [bacterium]